MIRFPKKHIADNVVDRINRYSQAQAAVSNPVAAQSAELDAALSQPVGDVAPIEGVEELLVTNSLGL